MGQVKIDEQVFGWLLEYFLLEKYENRGLIEDALREKLDKIVDHDLYTRYKSGRLTPEEREAARKAYLDRKGYLGGFRW